MYLPAHFEEVDEGEILALIENFPLATLVCHHDGEFVVNHIPLLSIDQGMLVGHIALANPLHKKFPHGTDAVAIFTAEDSYISPNWYATKKNNPRHVPTWNYQVAHLHGKIEFDNSAKAKLAAVGRLTKKYEEMYSGDQAWKIADAPSDYLETMLDNIVAFTFAVSTTMAKSKLSQNREYVDFESVQQIMTKVGRTGLADAMKRAQHKG